MANFDQTILHNNQKYTLCPFGHVIQQGDVVAQFLGQKTNVYVFERITKIYGVVRCNSFTTERYPTVFTEGYKPYNIDRSSIPYAVYQPQTIQPNTP